MTTTRWTRFTTALLALAAVLAGSVGSAAAAPATGAGAERRSIVRLSGAADPGDVTRQVRARGAEVERVLASVGVLVVHSTAPVADALTGIPGVASVAPDSRVALATDTYDPKADVASMYTVSTVIGARDAWGRYTGRGVDVALIDSGVSQVPGLDADGKVVRGPDLSFESQNAALRHGDTFGHGTHMAGIIAGRDHGTDVARTVAGDAYLGVAPDARIISLKVADAYGTTDVSQLIAAIDWVVAHRADPGMNIRVLNLSFGARPLQPYEQDPLAHAAEVAWRQGILVVVSAGNDGTGTGQLSNPAYDPWLLAVGAADANGTRDTADDTVPAYSSRGNGVRNPDLVAPGAHVQGLRVPGSSIDDAFGTGPGSIDARFLRGSGTSQAAAVVSGAAALLFQQRPSLGPDEAKAILTSTALPLPAADPQAAGHGLVNIKRALQAPTPATSPTWRRSTGTGTLEGARGGAGLVLAGVRLEGERDVFGRAFDAAGHAAAAEAGAAWDGGDWNGSTWAGTTWAGTTWAGTTWAGTTWAGTTWAGEGWTNGTWTGTTWAGTTWAGTTWASGQWVGTTWAGRGWAVGAWG